MIKFEKISFEEFKKSLINKYDDKIIKEMYDNIKLPQRGSNGSAGYDFFTPVGGNLKCDNNEITIPTGIKACMPKNVVLMLFPRSGVGFKTGTTLANTVGIIDSDYYNNPTNEGHIMLKIVHGFKDYEFKIGDRIMQGVFVNYLITNNDVVKQNERVGGLGSTGK